MVLISAIAVGCSILFDLLLSCLGDSGGVGQGSITLPLGLLHYGWSNPTDQGPEVVVVPTAKYVGLKGARQLRPQTPWVDPP